MPKDEKPRWVVRTWDLKTDQMSRALSLQWLLNDIETQGYEVRDINHDGGYVVAIRSEEVKVEVPPEAQAVGSQPLIHTIPKPLQQLIERLGGRLASMQMMRMSDLIPDQEKEPDPKGKRTIALMRGMSAVMDNVAQGADKRTAELQLECVIKDVFQCKNSDGIKATTEDVLESIKDLEHFSSLHAKDSDTCDGSCPTQKVIELGIAKLQEHLAANPAN